MAELTVPDAAAVVIGYAVGAPWADDLLGRSSIDGAPHVTGDVLEGSWPALRIFETPAGSDRRLELGVIEPELQVELWDHPERASQLGDAELRRRLYVILGWLVGLPERAWAADEPPISRVRLSNRAQSVPDPSSGQPRWLANATVVIRQAAALPA